MLLLEGVRTHQLQSLSSKKKISSTRLLKTLAILSDNRVDGTYFPISIELIVCRETPTFSASSAWVILCFARSTLSVFFIRPNLVLQYIDPTVKNSVSQREG